ncbi:MAG: hypothetical protein WD467_01645 [Candidatus Saccharimonadales bacterium]
MKAKLNLKDVLLALAMVSLFTSPFVSLQPEPVKADAVNILPNPADFSPGGNNFWVEVARNGNGNALDAPIVWLKLYFDQASGNRVRLINGDVCSSGVDTNTNAPTSFRWAQVNELGVREGENNPFFHFSSQLANCPDREFTIPEEAMTQSIRPESEGKYVVLLKALHTGGLNSGGVNAFKVQALNHGGIVGYADLAQNGTQYNDVDPSDGNQSGSDYGSFALQQRSGSGPGTFQLEFATSCLDADDIEEHNGEAYLKWFDADYGASNQPNNLNWRVEVRDRESGDRVPDEDFSLSGSQLGGNDEYAWEKFTVRMDRKYTWIWSNVATTNGIQIWMPYDSQNYNSPCDPGGLITGRKVVHQDDGSHVTDNGLNSVFIRHTAGPGSPQEEGQGGASYIIDGLQPGDHTFAFGMNNTLGNHPAAYEFLGLTMCVRTATTCVDQDSTVAYHNAAGHLQQNSITINVPNDSVEHYVSVWWHFERLAALPEAADHRIYGATTVDIPQAYVRDNEQFQINVLAYLWPNAGILDRGDDNNTNLWLAGIYGDDRGDSMGIGDQSSNAHPQTWTSFNLAAEANCPTPEAGLCRKRVPAAYVPQSDGTGVATTNTKDGSTTPGGNNWRSIRDESLGSQSSSQVTSCGNYTTSYNRYCGGVASGLNSNVGGFQGNRINNIEMSNIHIEGRGMSGLLAEGGLQGPIDRDLLQQPLLFPTDNSQSTLPRQSQGPDSGPAWDNIREPSTGLLNVTETSPNQTFPNVTSSGGVGNFVYDPQNIGTDYTAADRIYASGTAVSLLQDGQDNSNPPYDNPNEPLTYTASLDSIDRVDLQWDEYVDWSQVDDKGHWYTNQARRATGVDRGPRGGTTSTSVNRIQLTNYGSRQVTAYHWRCVHSNTGSSHTHSYSSIGSNPNNHHTGSWNCFRTGTSYTSTSTYCVGNTSVAYRNNSLNYYNDSTQSRYGWRNTQTTTQQMPYGGNGGNASSAFYSSYSTTPTWGRVGVTNFWQDSGVTNMSNSASSQKPSHFNRWIYNTSDPAYNNRHIFSQSITPSFRDDWYKTGSSCITRYPNGSHTTFTTTVSVASYYPSAKRIYEDTSSSAINGHVYGKYGNAATYDGNSDGLVDVGWSWASNLQRVRYEQTYTNRERKLGPRYRSGTGDERLYGTDPTRATLAGRGLATIYNPIVDVSAADVFSGGNLHSYFQDSQANSAFLFSNSQIINFRNQSRSFEDYNINPNRDRVGAFYPDGEDPVNYVFQDYQALVNTAADTCSIPNNLERASAQKSDNVFYCDGDLNLSSHTFTGGAGTIIVDGDLYITDNVSYNTALVNDRDILPSAGFIVTGNIYISPNVTSISGSYFANGCFNSGSLLLTDTSNRSCAQPVGNSNRILDDSPLSINGLVIANNFILARQPSGASNRLGNGAEQFFYDGRVVVNPPPGFSRIFTADAVWNDTVPRN